MDSNMGGTFATSSSSALADTGATYYQLATESNATTTAAITNALKFATSKSIRTSTIILASFNSVAAFTTALGIIYGCRSYKKRMQSRSSEPPSGLFFIHSAEVFPLVLSLGITIQSITFAAAQSVGLQALLSRGCTLVAIFMLPAVFIVPFTQLVFGVEAAFRGVRSQFAPRGKWNVTICLGIVTTLCLVALVVAAVDRAPDFCFASLFRFVRMYAPGCLGVLLGVLITLLVVIPTIFLKLNKSHMVDPIERMAASRMIYYLTLGFISNAFVVPFFFSLTFLDQKVVILDTLNLSMVASVVSNVNGLMVAGLHLFLRSQNKSIIGHNLNDYERKQYMYDPRDGRDANRGSNHSLQPVGAHNQARARSDSIATLLQVADAEEGRSMASPRSYGSTARNPFSPKLFIPAGPKYPEPIQPPSETSPSQLRKQSYSIFPQESHATASQGVLPATTYSPMSSKPIRDTWKPPPIVKPWVGRGHRRGSSIQSTATVQIGIRLSNVDDYVPRKSTDTDVPDVPEVPNMANMPPMPVVRPSPLAEVETRSESEYTSEYEDTDLILDNPLKKRSIRDARMKTLPPVPSSPAQAGTSGNVVADEDAASPVEEGTANEQEKTTLITLSPTVYTPDDSLHRSPSNRSVRKLPSPMGVGFNTPPGRGPHDRSPIHAPPRPTGSAATTPLPTTSTKADWI